MPSASHNRGVLMLILGLVGPVLAVVLFLIGRANPELSYRVTGPAEVLDVQDDSLQSLEVTFDGTRVEQSISTVTVVFENTGNRPISASDFDGDLEVLFEPGSQILAVSVVDRQPPSLSPLIHASGLRVGVSPLLLNPGDRLGFVAYVAGDTDEVEVKGRVSGVPEPARMSPMPETPPGVGIVFGALLLVASAAYFYTSALYGELMRMRRALGTPSCGNGLAAVAFALVIISGGLGSVFIDAFARPSVEGVWALGALLVAGAPMMRVGQRHALRLSLWIREHAVGEA